MFSDISDLGEFKEEVDTSASKPKFTKFAKKAEVVTDIPYIPISIFIDREFPSDVKEKMYHIVSKLLNSNYVIRLNGDDKEFYERVKTLADERLEMYTPWKAFNDIETKYYFNSKTSTNIAIKHFPAWEKLPNPVKSMLARNVRMLFGDKNNSLSLCLITWSKDGASKPLDITKETGRASFIIRVASSYAMPVLNLGKSNTIDVIEKTFNIG